MLLIYFLERLMEPLLASAREHRHTGTFDILYLLTKVYNLLLLLIFMYLMHSNYYDVILLLISLQINKSGCTGARIQNYSEII